MSAAGQSATLNFAASSLAASAAANAADGLALQPVDNSAINLWIDGTATLHMGSQGGIEHWGNMALLSMGADMLVNESLLVGAALHGDWMDDIAVTSRVAGQGILAGPYLSAELGKGVFLDAGLYYGRSWNRISTTLFSGTFETERLLANMELKGEWALSQSLVLRPSVEAFYLREQAGAYSVADRLGNVASIDAALTEQLRLSADAVLQYELYLDSGLRVRPFAGLQLGWTLSNGSGGGHGSLTAGFDLTGLGQWTLGGRTQASFAADGLRAVSVSAALRAPF